MTQVWYINLMFHSSKKKKKNHLWTIQAAITFFSTENGDRGFFLLQHVTSTLLPLQLSLLLFSGGFVALTLWNCKLLIKYLNCILRQTERMHSHFSECVWNGSSHIPLAVCPCLCSSLKSQWWGSHAELSVPLHPVSAIVTLILSFVPASIRLTVVITRLHWKLTL